MTKIPYCDETWNVTAGCTKCAPGCEHCWAEKWANRFDRTYDTKGNLRPYYCRQGYNYDWKGLVACRPDVLDKPLHWRKPRRIFVNSMSDLFHKDVPFEFIDKVFYIAALCHQHTFIFFTKRIKRAAEYNGYVNGEGQDTRTRIAIKLSDLTCRRSAKYHYAYYDMKLLPLPNVQLILSLSTQKEADEKIPILLQIPAAVRGLSLEPLLEEIDLTDIHEKVGLSTDVINDQTEDVAKWNEIHKEFIKTPLEPEPVLDWVIVGGESGPKARPMHADWARSIRDQCVAAGVPFYFKQWGEYIPHKGLVVDSDVVFLKDGTLMNTKDVFRNGWQKYYDTPTDCIWMKRVGKKKAGDILDGKEWKQYP